MLQNWPSRNFLSFIFIAAFGFWLSPVFSSTQEISGRCPQLLSLLRERKSAQPVQVELQNLGVINVRNHEFLGAIAAGYSAEFLGQFVLRLIEEGSLELPINSKGVMVAAPSGVYSRKGWDRDDLRGLAAIRALGRNELSERMLGAEIERYGKQVGRILGTLQDIEDHPRKEERRYVREGHSSLPQVVFDPETLDDLKDADGRVVPWSAQKDAWALFVHSVQDGMDLDSFPVNTLTTNQKLAVVGMPALLERLEFWDLPTADTWEEENQVFTGSVALATSALERLYDSIYAYGDGSRVSTLARLIKEVVADDQIDARTRKILKGALTPESLSAAVNKGYKRAFAQLEAGGESPKIGDAGMGRTADIALLWTFAYRLKQFTEDHYRKVLEIAETLVRGSGMPRYLTPYKDGYLNPGYFFGDNEVLPREMTRVDKVTLTWGRHEEQREITGGLVRQLFFERRIEKLEEIFGPDFSAQWGLGLAFMIQANLKMYHWFPNSPHRMTYLKKARDFMLRMAGTLTPGPRKSGGGSQERAISLDGREVPAYRFGEADTEISIFGPSKEVVEKVWAYSPFTQLNWYTAEAIIALKGLWEVEFPDKPFPLQ